MNRGTVIAAKQRTLATCGASLQQQSGRVAKTIVSSPDLSRHEGLLAPLVESS